LKHIYIQDAKFYFRGEKMNRLMRLLYNYGIQLYPTDDPVDLIAQLISKKMELEQDPETNKYTMYLIDKCLSALIEEIARRSI